MEGKNNESSDHTSNSSPNLSTNDLKSQKNNSTSASNPVQNPKEKNSRNQQENAQANQINEPDNSNQMNNKQNSLNMGNNFSNLYQMQGNINPNYQPMILTYPMGHPNIEASHNTIPIMLNNNPYRLLQNPVPSVVYVPNPPTPYFVSQNGFQQAPFIFKNIPMNNLNRGVNQNQQFFLMNPYGNPSNEKIDIQAENFDKRANEKNQGFCFVNQNLGIPSVQISNNNQNPYKNIIYVHQKNEPQNFISNQNLVPPMNFIQNLQILQPQTQGFCPNGNFYPSNFTNNETFQKTQFNNTNNLNENHKPEEN